MTLLYKYKAEGYGVYWCIIEMLHKEQCNKLEFKEYNYISIAEKMKTTPSNVEDIINYCINPCELFVSDLFCFWSDRVCRNIEKMQLNSKFKSLAGKASAAKRLKIKENPTPVEQNLTPVEQESVLLKSVENESLKTEEKIKIKEKIPILKPLIIEENPTPVEQQLNRIQQNKIKEKKINNNIIKKINKKDFELILPFRSDLFVKTWNELLSMPKWRNKPETAISKSLDKLANYSENDAIQMMNNAIIGNWQGLFELKDNNYARKSTNLDNIKKLE
jgi:hypothetical protein